MMKQRPSWKRTRRIIGLCAVVGLLWVTILQYRMANVPDNTLAHGEVGIILGSSLKDNAATPSLRERLEGGIKLFKERKIQHIIVSGGLDRSEFHLTEAEGMRNYLLERGIADNVIVMEQEATSTYENLLFSQQIMKQQNWHSAVVITHRYHMLRAMEMAAFLNYEQVEAFPVDSKAVNNSWNLIRETLAHGKWMLDQLFITINGRQ
ncbi:protein SanA, affects membrane permeability for vancomycin [Paenibacillus sp. 1_12]|uniref:YdcF family protein n=1 Tax=Paenibacillus sp. 1_12 TaxID=1566278 RepID=UPI0008EDD048|nr:YdcF family protein [Paenibacillus sp. 1_12]SFL84364.1 protein SanA, affects membrane permeability for vancomycin [Paenibacillus sp. 1_12]